MRTIYLLRTLFLCYFTLGWALAHPGVAASGQFASSNRGEQALELIVAAGKKIERLESKFKQTRYISFMDEKLVSQGFFIFQPPDNLVWQYDSPAFFRLDYQNGRASLQSGADSPKQNAYEAEFAAKIGQQIMLWVSLDLDSIRASYHLEIVDSSPLKLYLTPKKPSTTPITEIELIFAANGKDVEQVILHETDGDYTTLDFFDSKRMERN
jgi:hypothetical protein